MVNKKKYKKSIELFHEKSGELVRIIRFKNSKDFDNFLYGYSSMRYPGYNWRDCKNKKKLRDILQNYIEHETIQSVRTAWIEYFLDIKNKKISIK